MQNVKQTGLLIKPPSPNDYIAGGLSGIAFEERIFSGDWDLYLPTIERQYRRWLLYSFDTLSCVSFAALNVVEFQVNYLIQKEMIDGESLQYLIEAGYIDENGNFNCSDKFTAIMSETTDRGNYFYKVWDSIREDGILPEKDLSMGNSSNFEEYHDPKQITQEMKDKAKKILDIFDFKYEWVYFDDDRNMNMDEKAILETHLKQSPLEIAIPVPGAHAITLTDIDGDIFKAFDHYEPFERKWIFGDIGIHFAFKGYVGLKMKKDSFKHTFTKDLTLGDINNDVLYLQKALNNNTDTQVSESGAGSPGKETNYFGPATLKAVQKFQMKHGITPVLGFVGPKTRAKLNELYGNGEVVVPPSNTSKIDLFAKSIQTHEGYYPGSRSYRNCSPGNFKQKVLSQYMKDMGAIGLDPQNFVIFPNIQTGTEALKTFLRDACLGNLRSYHSDMNLVEFFAGVKGSDRYTGYAPATDHNVPERYAQYVARDMGVDINTKLKQLI